MSDGGGGDECVKGSGGGFASVVAEICGDPAEGTCRSAVERNRVEVGFGLLQVGQACRPLRLVIGDQWTCLLYTSRCV